MSTERLDNARARLQAFVGDVESDDAKSRRRRQILEAATERFTENGYRKTSVDEIARAAGVAKGTVYLYYANKTELIFACIAHEKLQILDRFAFFFDPGIPARTRLRRWLTEIVAVSQDMPLTRGLLARRGDLNAVLAEAPPELVEQREEDIDTYLGSLIEEAVGPGKLAPDVVRDRARVLASLATYANASKDSGLRQGLGPRRFASVMADMVLDGLLNRGEDPTSISDAGADSDAPRSSHLEAPHQPAGGSEPSTRFWPFGGLDAFRKNSR